MVGVLASARPLNGVLSNIFLPLSDCSGTVVISDLRPDEIIPPRPGCIDGFVVIASAAANITLHAHGNSVSCSTIEKHLFEHFQVGVN